MDQHRSPGNAELCQICGGSGWKMVTSPSGAQSAMRCECRFGSWSDRLLKQARIPARYEHCTLENFDTEVSAANSTIATALMEAQHFVERYPLDTYGLMLLGPIGVGKTHLAIGILQELIKKKNIPCLFYDYRELLKEIQNSYNASVQATELDILKPVFEAEVLVLDELGVVRSTDWVWDTVNYILNTRYNQNKTTIITSNLSDLPAGGNRPQNDKMPLSVSKQNAEEAMREVTLGDRIGDRMHSRLQEMCVKIRMTGDDFRIRKAKASKLQGASVQFRLSRKKNQVS